MLVMSRRDLQSLLKPDELNRIYTQLAEPGEEALLYVCSNERIYLGMLKLDGGVMDFERFLPSTTFMNLYLDLPDDKVLPCPLCSHDPSVIRMENVDGKIRVYSS